MLRVRRLFSTISRQTDFSVNYDALNMYKKVEGHLGIPKGYVAGADGNPKWPAQYIDCPIGKIAESIRRRIKKNTLPKADVEKLNNMGFVLNLKSERKNIVKMAFELYVERFGNGRVHRDFAIDKDDLSWPVRCRGVRLGHVLAKIRCGCYQSLLPDLVAMGIAVENQHNPPNFDRNFRALKVYKELNGTLTVRDTFEIGKNDLRYPPEARGIKLGVWMRNLKKRGYFAEHRQTLLDFGVPLDYKPSVKTGFEFYYTALMVYKSIHGTVEVPPDFIVPDDPRYPVTARGTKLGAFVAKVKEGGYQANRQRLKDLGVKMLTTTKVTVKQEPAEKVVTV